ncbi:bifunctional 5,10-methylene-tetrahydrofolate dehydrogenase and 5,10-methylene-tetrahydrofolate cyclohydrolase [Capnocytophaga canimorsus]|uniref:Bifunctional protein FolD n=1 Tax=Capnocytophaga canimorsus TaxID=28188 RepID=A0A0B7H8D6_9FLAO|nr:bifunctional methylenetetrahydrofolate dehydrogenase/methenyltetrahydrofolate cyclohydrolase FolD [Capnocytophaga canimorsus]ATA76611.1 bifunctional 5,10-methylene-tetrahydrofolate dehydrogenase/5,10-methylene-tetrahydrofolate cyclohydrolase [Capnocytophaga canimorsus]PJI76989.1 methylenetetrahydrofolate dehydrogenase (NADP+)/methenyltetrahydrofolate cyclohydrolase [Capnocytophaga canimorsus]CEN35886.1 bifunctional 5,10-methylene-tetrahydrofolate dehydrogenase and 5,10-methylene-tetrahydrofol
MKLLDGKKTSEDIKNEIAQEVKALKAQGKKVPHLAAVLVGNDGASLTYVGSKVKACQQVGFESTLIKLPTETTEKELLEKIKRLNEDENIDGYIVQLPLPKHIDSQKVLLAVSPEKDVDGFHPANFGKIALDMEAFIPATPFGIMELLKRYQVPTQGKHVVVVGRSHIVGRPMSILLSQKGNPGNATVTLTHSHTENLSQITRQADIIIMALGIPEFLKADMVKEGATVVDVGITRLEDKNNPKGYRIVGDVDFEQVKDKADFITPVPGGVGPMTIAMLLKNTLLARKWKSDV